MLLLLTTIFILSVVAIPIPMMPRPRDEAAQVPPLSESLRRSATISVVLTIVTVLTIIGVSVYLYRRRHPKTSFAPLNSSIELLPITSANAAIENSIPSRQGKRRVAASLAKKARRVFSKGRLSTFSGRRWGRRNQKVVHWDLPEDDHQPYTDTEDDENTLLPRPSELKPNTHEADRSINPQSLIDLSLTQEDDIGDPFRCTDQPLVELEEARRPWLGTTALTPTSSTSSNPSPYPSQDLVDLSVKDGTTGPFTRPKLSLASYPLLVPSSPLDLTSSSPTSNPAYSTTKGMYPGYELGNVWAPVHLSPALTSVPPTVLDKPATVLAGKNYGAEAPFHTNPQSPKNGSPAGTSEVVALVEDKAASLLHALSSPIHGSQQVSPSGSPVDTDPFADPKESEVVNLEGLASDIQLVALPGKPLPSPLPATTLKELDDLELSCYPVFEEIGMPSPASSARGIPHPHSYVIADGIDDAKATSSSPIKSPRSSTTPGYPELHSKLLTPEYTPPLDHDDQEPKEILELEERQNAPDSRFVSPATSQSSLPSLHSNDLDENLNESDDDTEDEDDDLSIYSDPELPPLPSMTASHPHSPIGNVLLHFQAAVQGIPMAMSNNSVPRISISIPTADKHNAGDPDLPVITPIYPPIIIVAPIQTPTPPPSPPSQFSPLPLSPHPRLLALQNREGSSDLVPTSPLLRPAWSTRASDAPTLGLAPPKVQKTSPAPTPISSPAVQAVHSLPGSFAPDDENDECETASEGSSSPTCRSSSDPDRDLVVQNPPALEEWQPPRLRNLRSPVDIALAMQLRPGLGLGADPAWMVRFLMSMFGWLAVLVGTNGDF